MNPSRREPAPPPCPAFEEACALTAWGESVPRAAQEHIGGCPGCQAAVARARALAKAAGRWAGPAPHRLRDDLAAGVFAATTRRNPDRGRRPRVWIGAGAGLAAAGLAAVTWWRSRGPDAEQAVPDFAAVELELLEDLELAENLDLLEVLDALEELDHV